jgi:hypothetical protein
MSGSLGAMLAVDSAAVLGVEAYEVEIGARRQDRATLGGREALRRL